MPGMENFDPTRQVIIENIELEGLKLLDNHVAQNIVEKCVVRSGNAGEVMASLHNCVHDFKELGVFKSVDLSILQPAKKGKGSHLSVIPLDVCVTVIEGSRMLLKTGTHTDGQSGGVSFSCLLRNMASCADKLSATSTVGSKFPTSFSLFYDVPNLGQFGLGASHAIQSFRCGLFSQTVDNLILNSHVQKLDRAQFNVLARFGSFSHNFTLFDARREVTGILPTASTSIKTEAGVSHKTGIQHSCERDDRDNAQMPSHGSIIRLKTEICGPVGDVSLVKSVVEGQLAASILPGLSIIGAFKFAGVRPLGMGCSITDKVFLSGPADIRGFKTKTLGPRMGTDVLGGNVAYCASLRTVFSLPFLTNRTRVFGQLFANIGGLCESLSLDGMNSLVQNSKLSIGMGLATEIVGSRVELNYCTPIMYDEVTSSEDVACHFYKHDFSRCSVLDQHLGILAPRHPEAKFIKLDVEKTPFFVQKLQIRVLPALLFFKSGVNVDRYINRMIGFEELGNTDSFETEVLEARMVAAGTIHARKSKAPLDKSGITGLLGRNYHEDSDSD